MTQLKQKNLTPSQSTVPQLPKESQLAKIASLLTEKFTREENERKWAKTKQILTLLTKGTFLTMSLIAPKTASATHHLLQEEKDWNTWKRFNPSYLRQTLKRLEKQKAVEIVEENGMQVVKLTSKGKRRILKYAISELEVKKPKTWDRKWRLVIYDISNSQKQLQVLIRETLKNLGFFAMQESVYIYPFPCFDEIEFLREYYGLGSQIQYLLVEEIENDQVYKTYFNLT
jgi:DNA-binding PadR family transcriptional regulator